MADCSTFSSGPSTRSFGSPELLSTALSCEMTFQSYPVEGLPLSSMTSLAPRLIRKCPPDCSWRNTTRTLSSMMVVFSDKLSCAPFLQLLAATPEPSKATNSKPSSVELTPQSCRYVEPVNDSVGTKRSGLPGQSQPGCVHGLALVPTKTENSRVSFVGGD